jgi:[FeFe] hydrogenase H-cluster maturation GTPase HydF
MNSTPRGNRLHIALFGRVNCGKSSLLNLLTGQQTALVSEVAGTTTDPVEKAAELPSIGPVQLIDTPGLDDHSTLAALRRSRTDRAFERASVGILVLEPGRWSEAEDLVVERCRVAKIPLVAVVNKCDLATPEDEFLARVKARVPRVVTLSCQEPERRDAYVRELRQAVSAVIPADESQRSLLGDLVTPGGIVVLVTPIDLEAPKGRLILPQAQTIREALDIDAVTVVVKERELSHALKLLKRRPDLVVCDSQVILKVVADLPREVACTTFSILFARARGDLIEASRGAARLRDLRAGDRILIAEACTHHALEDDIGRVRIPRWLRQYVGADLSIDHVSGCTFPPELAGYDAVIHCGACMLTRREMLHRVAEAKGAGVAITNYGMAIAFLQGVIERALAPFPGALRAYSGELRSRERAATAVGA